MRAGIVILALALAFSTAAATQPVVESERPIPAFDRETFTLSHEGRAYLISVDRTGDGGRPESTVPRVYVLQGEQYGDVIAALLRRAHGQDGSQGVVISIARADLDPDAQVDQARAREFIGDEAPAFRRFLIERLRPEIDRRLGADPWESMLAGQGDAAYFVLGMAAETPEAFDTFVAAGRPRVLMDIDFQVVEGRANVYMSAPRFDSNPMEDFEGLAADMRENGREIRIATLDMETSFTDQIGGLWNWIGPEFIPPPI